ncbi:CsgG/HfaB family protein [uncultured Desulfovibrio sp.]|uniref:CsgG/HfaB family protein n=1 Tax=uncultured Desulfovibrio sp. TaxID=167968 RepID=UPI00260D525D|nr:CsgG/HfaB family protein [uncultured Desulfovibrio sp.]
MLDIYLPPDYPITYFSVKPITDATGISKSGGEIPLDITTLVRDAISQLYTKIRHVEQYDQSDITHLQAEGFLRNMAKIQTQPNLSLRPSIDFTVTGRISQFDRNISSSSTGIQGMGNIGKGLSRTDASASVDSSSRLSRLAISLNVYTSAGVSIPGKLGASMEVMYAKNGVDIGFAIFGNGFGIGSEATAMHGRHLALQMMAELSVAQMVGRIMSVPYWRIGGQQKIFKEDRLVYAEWQTQYSDMVRQGLILPYMQAACIACGDTSVAVTGQLDSATRAAFERFAKKYGVRSRTWPSFELFKALELNRLLDRNVSSAAWAAYAAYKAGGVGRAAAPQAQPVSAPAPRKAAPASAPAPRKEARPSAPSSRKSAPSADDVALPLDKLL